MPGPTNHRAAALGAVGLVYGVLTAFAELAYLPVAWLALSVGLRKPALIGASWFADLERIRLARFFAVTEPGSCDAVRALRYLSLRWTAGMLAGGIFVLIAWGLVSGAIMAWQLVTGRAVGGGVPTNGAQAWLEPAGIFLLGLLLFFLAVQGLLAVAGLDRRLARRFLGPDREELLRARISELSTTRAQVVEAVNEERKRIERDLHDGVQQRLVGLGVLLGRARRAADPDHARELLRQAHEQSYRGLEELREVAWRVYPIALSTGGLPAALESLAAHSSLPVTLRCELSRRLDASVETAAYFVACEAMTNAAKHAHASHIDILVNEVDGWLAVGISDNGIGGADPSGSGLSGLARRVGAADGRFSVHSPPGGPTRVTARLPCE